MAVTFYDSGVTADSILIGTTPSKPARNAKEILEANPNAPTGFYWVNFPGTTGDVPLLVQCDMTGALCGSSVGGWMKFDIGTVNRYRRLLQNNDTRNRNSPTSAAKDGEPLVRLNKYNTSEASSNGTIYFPAEGVSGELGTMRSIKIRVPYGSRGIRVQGFDFYSVSGPDGASFDDSGDNPTVAPTKQQIVSCGDGTTITLGSNYSSFGIYFGDGSGNGKRLFIGNSASPWTGEVNGGFVSLPQSRFVQWDDIGNDADRIIFYESDGDGEYDNIYGFSFWIR